MWVTGRFGWGATTTQSSGRSQVWNNETVNGLHLHYGFSLTFLYVLCSRSSTNRGPIYIWSKLNMLSYFSVHEKLKQQASWSISSPCNLCLTLSTLPSFSILPLWPDTLCLSVWHSGQLFTGPQIGPPLSSFFNRQKEQLGRNHGGGACVKAKVDLESITFLPLTAGLIKSLISIQPSELAGLLLSSLRPPPPLSDTSH